MSHRCYICDFSPTVPSVYHEGLVTNSAHRNHLLYDPDKATYICSECANSIRYAPAPDDVILEDIILESDDDITQFPRFAEE